jgi:aminoglycoside 3-N-acetyltransferase
VARRVLRYVVPRVFRARLISTCKTASAYRDRLCSIDTWGLTRALLELGLRPGEIVFVHAAYSQMRSIRATPLEIIEALCRVMGQAGTVAMPTFPMNGPSQTYLEHHPVFDWRRTPSQAGLLTEVFRRMPGTERSLHPTHPVGARGAAAAWLTAGHERSCTPFDEHSPFQKLLERDAFILSLGSFEAMTLRHLADHLIQGEIPLPIYSQRKTKVRLITREGKEHSMETQGHYPSLTNHRVVLETMDREGLRRSGKAGRLQLALVRARAYVECYHRCYRQNLIKHSLISW